MALRNSSKSTYVLTALYFELLKGGIADWWVRYSYPLEILVFTSRKAGQVILLELSLRRWPLTTPSTPTKFTKSRFACSWSLLNKVLLVLHDRWCHSLLELSFCNCNDYADIPGVAMNEGKHTSFNIRDFIETSKHSLLVHDFRLHLQI